MANKTFNTRVKNKRDTAANWEAVATTFQPLDGELIIVDTSAGKTRFKVGRYDTAKGRLLYYNEIPFADEYLYNDLNESQGKIYDKLKGIDDKSIIEMTLESVFDNTKFVNYRIGLWQFPKTGFYKLNIAKRGTTATQLFLYAQKTKEDGTTPEDPFSQDNLLRISPLTGDKQVESVFVQVDYTDTDALTVYKVQFLNVMTFPGTININTYNKTTQKWDFTSVTESSAKWANNATQVSNALTLTKGDTTTKFDGSTAQTVEIPTKTSELTNDSFVSYAEQTLTEDQQNQAKTNLGIDVLTGNTTTVTPTQVKEAILAGRPVAITHVDNTYGNLLFTSFGYSLENNVVVANLVSTYNTQYILADLVGMSNNDQWNLNTAELGTSTDIDNLKLNMINNYVKYSEAQTLTDGQKSQARTNIGAMENVIAGPNTLGGVQPYSWMYSDNTPRVDVCVNDEGRLLVCGAEVKGTRKVSNFCKFVNGSFSDDVFNSADYGSCIVTSLRTTGLSQSAPENLTVPLLILFGEGDRGEYPIIGFDSAGKTFKGKINSSLSSPSYEITITNEIDSEVIPNSTNAVTGNGVFELVNNFTEYVDGNYVSCLEAQTEMFTDDQKQVARNNIGIKDPFKVTFTRDRGKVSADKTAKEISDAHNSGCFVYGCFSDTTEIYYLVKASTTSLEFVQFNYIYKSMNTFGVDRGLCYCTLYANNITETFTGNYDEDFSYNIAAPSFNIITIKSSNGMYSFENSNYNYPNINLMMSTYSHYVNSNVFLSYNDNLYKLSKTFIDGISALVFERMSYDSASSSILFETFTINTDSTITYDSQTFEQTQPVIDTTLSSTSENAVQNKVVKAAIEEVQSAIDSKADTTALTQVTNDVAANYVKFAAEQTLTDEQKAQARENIGAVGESDITIFPVKISALQGGGMSNKTAKEIYDAHSAGKIVIATAANGSQYSLSIASMSSSKYQICFSAVKYDSSSTQTYLEFYYLKDASGSSTARYTFYTYNFDDQYVKFTAEQTLTDDQKAQARENINAPSPADAVYTVTASSTDGVAYTATVSGIDSLTVGASFIMIPNKASTSKAPTLDVNGLGAKPIRRRLSSLTTSLQQGYSTNWIALNKPFTVVYDGTAWIVEGLTKTDGADVYGAVAQATADANGNNIVDTYATIAMLQSLLPKVTTITLTTNWTGSASPYYQDIALSCVTETSIVDLQPTPEQLASWQDEGLAFTTLSGNGTVRVYVAGGKPSSAITVQVRVQEVTVI